MDAINSISPRLRVVIRDMSRQLCSKVFTSNPSEEVSMSTRCMGEGGIITYKRTSHSSGFVDVVTIESFEAKYGVKSAKESIS